jgi:hypothetical protein
MGGYKEVTKRNDYKSSAYHISGNRLCTNWGGNLFKSVITLPVRENIVKLTLDTSGRGKWLYIYTRSCVFRMRKISRKRDKNKEYKLQWVRGIQATKVAANKEQMRCNKK